jgi:hypothetical protein
MKTTVIASALCDKIPGADYTVMIRTSGAGTVDVTIWLSNDEALELSSQIRAAVAQSLAQQLAAVTEVAA